MAILYCIVLYCILTVTNTFFLYFSLTTPWPVFGISLNICLLNILQVRMRFWSLFKRLHQKTKYGGPTSAWVTTTAPYRRPSSATSWRMQAGECRQATLHWKKCDGNLKVVWAGFFCGQLMIFIPKFGILIWNLTVMVQSNVPSMRSLVIWLGSCENCIAPTFCWTKFSFTQFQVSYSDPHFL